MSTDDLVTPRTALPAQRRPLVRRRRDAGPSVEVARPRRIRSGIEIAGWVVLIDLIALSVAVMLVSGGTLPMILFVGTVLALNACGGFYRARFAPSVLDELPGLAGRALVAGAIATAAAVYLERPVQEGPLHASLIFLGIAFAGRTIGYPLLRRARSVRQAGRPTIIIGSGHVGEQIATRLLNHPEYGLRPIGFVDDRPPHDEGSSDLPLLGRVDALPDLLQKHEARDVIVAFSTTRESTLVDVLRRCDRARCEIFVVPRFYELDGAGRSNEVIWDLPLTRLRRSCYRSPSWRIKRLFDISAAGVGLLLLSPILALCALLVRIEGGPGVIFRQERIGVDGRPFMILKFRSLKPSSEAESAQLWNIAQDPRLGPIGKRLRQLSLDELPQLWNILRGDMSLVGPRPERPVFVDTFSQQFPRYISRHRVPAGLTGWAQVNGLRGDTDISDRAAFDNYYIENWSMWSDMKIILRTVGQVVSRRGM